MSTRVDVTQLTLRCFNIILLVFCSGDCQNSFLENEQLNLGVFFLCVQYLGLCRRVVAPECSSEVREKERKRVANVEETREMKGGCDVGEEED